jgi:hypothetical protein
MSPIIVPPPKSSTTHILVSVLARLKGLEFRTGVDAVKALPCFLWGRIMCDTLPAATRLGWTRVSQPGSSASTRLPMMLNERTYTVLYAQAENDSRGV